MTNNTITINLDNLSTTGVIVLRDVLNTEFERSTTKKEKLRLSLNHAIVKSYLKIWRDIE
jgi:hypothetical protein